MYALIRIDDMTDPGDYGICDVYTLVGCVNDTRDIETYLTGLFGVECKVKAGTKGRLDVVFDTEMGFYLNHVWRVVETQIGLSDGAFIGGSCYIE